MPHHALALISSVALASTSLAERGPERIDEVPLESTPPTRAVADLRGFGGQFVTMRDEFENYPANTSLGGVGINAPPASFTGPVGFEWGTNNLRGQSSINFVRVVDLSGGPVGGSNGVVNGTRALRLRTATAQPAVGFFLGANIRWPTPLQAIIGTNSRVSAEHYLSTIDDRYTFEVVSIFQGVIVESLVWGGNCQEQSPGDCTDIGLPIGPLPYFSTRYTPPFGLPELRPLRYCADLDGNPFPGCTPPPGVMVGDPVAPPIANWFRLATELRVDGVFEVFLDALDGNGETLIHRRELVSADTIDRISWNASFSFQDAFMLIDNVETSGVVPTILCSTDFNVDGVTDFTDVLILANNFGATGASFLRGDTNADGVVDFTDLNAVLAAFGTSCQ